MTLVLADTSVGVRERQAPVAAFHAVAVRAKALAIVLPIALELLRSTPFTARRARAVHEALAAKYCHRGPTPTGLMAAAAESVDTELWHCDRHFDLIAEVTGQPMRRVGE